MEDWRDRVKGWDDKAVVELAFASPEGVGGALLAAQKDFWAQAVEQLARRNLASGSRISVTGSEVLQAFARDGLEPMHETVERSLEEMLAGGEVLDAERLRGSGRSGAEPEASMAATAATAVRDVAVGVASGVWEVAGLALSLVDASAALARAEKAQEEAEARRARTLRRPLYVRRVLDELADAAAEWAEREGLVDCVDGVLLEAEGAVPKVLSASAPATLPPAAAALTLRGAMRAARAGPAGALCELDEESFGAVLHCLEERGQIAREGGAVKFVGAGGAALGVRAVDGAALRMRLHLSLLRAPLPALQQRAARLRRDAAALYRVGQTKTLPATLRQAKMKLRRAKLVERGIDHRLAAIGNLETSLDAIETADWQRSAAEALRVAADALRESNQEVDVDAVEDARLAQEEESRLQGEIAEALGATADADQDQDLEAELRALERDIAEDALLDALPPLPTGAPARPPAARGQQTPGGDPASLTGQTA